MHVNLPKTVFNLFNTNGRRSDIINAYKIYIEILEQVYNESDSRLWGSYPNEMTQFRFYELAIQNSPEIFKKHPIYDKFIKSMEDQALRAEFDKKNISHLKKTPETAEIYDYLDSGIEARARHYTSNLVKIGLADANRQVSPIGKSWIAGKKLRRSKFEKLLPIDETNLTFFRQLMKLRVYARDGTQYYSPMMMAFYILLQNERVSQDYFIGLIQILNPNLPIKPSVYISEFLGGSAQYVEREYVPYEKEIEFEEIAKEPTPMSHESFIQYFSNRKSGETSSREYWDFYERLVKFNQNRTKGNLENLMTLFSIPAKKKKLNKAFGFNRDIFKFDSNDTNNVNKFMENNEGLDIFDNDDLNKKLFLQFHSSKRSDDVYEYGQNTRRLLKVTGIISFKNGIVELKQRELWKTFFADIDLENLIFNDSTKEEFEQYEKSESSPFLNHLTLEEIVGYTDKEIDSVISEIKHELNLSNEEEIRGLLYNKTSNEFNEYIEENYDKDKTFKILSLFSDRRNDDKIKEIVAKDGNIPTIFEFIVGIAWYHISSEKFDLFSSLNLSMSADFEPEIHAGGGKGDIVIEYTDYILMIEVTLMNKHAQKRGEWEPVLRHATNLTIESSPKEVITLFIADELDENTINIWRAVAMVPLESSRKSGKYADRVTIMPLQNNEILMMLKSDIDESKVIGEVKRSFSQLTNEFNQSWRNEIIEEIGK